MPKHCTKCQIEKPATREFYYAGKKWSDGFHPHCKTCQIAYAVAYKRRHPEKARANRKAWRQRNPENGRSQQRRRRATVEGALHNRMATRINAALRKKGRGWELLVGYTVDDLKAHLERQFTGGMGWHNRSEWHVDHIVPVSHFKFSSFDDPDFKACWALSNLRPLWSKQNCSKGGRRELLL